MDYLNISDKPKCFVLIGPPACGKSTLREKMIEQLGEPVIISSDDLIEEVARETGKTYAEVFAETDFKAQKKALRGKFLRALMDKKDIIIDRTNMTVKGRRSFLASVPRSYFKVGVLIGYDMDTVLERLDRRGRETGKTIPVSVVEEMVDRYQAPAEGEFDKVVKV